MASNKAVLVQKCSFETVLLAIYTVDITMGMGTFLERAFSISTLQFHLKLSYCVGKVRLSEVKLG